MIAPLIFDIARGSFSDGPGVRTVVFFKGCPLRCAWCHNPESQSPKQEHFFFSERCIRCARCKRGLSCFTNARRAVGLEYAPDDLVDAILRDEPYYNETGGGVTFSGGEPLMFIPYLHEVLPKLKQSGVRVAIQTAGHFDFEIFREKISGYVDLVYYDLKIYNSKAHELYTGVANDTILANLPRLINLGIEVVPRIPLIAKYTATKENLSQLAEYLRELAVERVEFLFHNPASEEKRERLGQRPQHGHVEDTISPDMQNQLIDYFQSCFKRELDSTLGLPCFDPGVCKNSIEPNQATSRQ